MNKTYSFDITGLIKPLFPNETLEIRYYGVKRIHRNPDMDEEALEKARRLLSSDTDLLPALQIIKEAKVSNREENNKNNRGGPLLNV